MATLEFQVEIKAPVNKVFKFIADGENAPKWHPSIIKAERLENTKLGVGSTVRYHAKIGPLNLIWVTKAVEFEWNKKLRDILVRVEEGPLKEYELKGLFKQENNKTTVTMMLNYKLSWGPIGSIIDKLVVAKRIRSHMNEGLNKAKKLLETKT